MKKSSVWQFLHSATTRLATTYLIIIMIMSLGFSIVLYNTSSQQLGRQIPPDSFFMNNGPQPQTSNAEANATQSMGGQGSPQSQRVGQFLQDRANEGRHLLLMRLILLNIVALLLGAIISYLLARRSLRPIEQAMDAQVQFVSDASHELRTPLTAMQTSNEVFLRRPKTSVRDAKELIEQNNDDIARLRALSDALLSLAQHKQLKLHRQPIALQDLVSSALTQIVPPATDKRISVEDNSEPITISGDYDLLLQTLVILLDNAVKYSQPDGTVTVATRQRGKFVYIDVTDQGIGIRASDLPHLFRRFYRADNARSGGERGGYGLGLAIAKQIIDAHHGDIEIASTIGQGSMFSLKLPQR